jgi:Protein of unknown function (DUF3522)
MLFIFILARVIAQMVQERTELISGHCFKMLSCFEKFYMPEYPLVYFYVEITLYDLDPPLSEYPVPVPVSYGRFDGTPNEVLHDSFVDLRSKHGYLIRTQYPKYSRMFVIRLDGGLLNELHLFTAYTVWGWNYDIEMHAYYCASSVYTVFPWNFSPDAAANCSAKLVDINEAFSGPAASMVYVPPSVSKFDIYADGNYSISPYNYNASLTTGLSIYLHPVPGWWFFVYESEGASNVSYQPYYCSYETPEYCGPNTTYIPTVPTYTRIPSSPALLQRSNESATYISFSVSETDLKYRYSIVISSMQSPQVYYSTNTINNSTSICNKMLCKHSSNQLVAEIQYLSLGTQYISIYLEKPEEFYMSLIRTEVGDDMCNGEEYWNINDLVYECACSQNKAGFYCDRFPVSDSEYFAGVMMLTISNLAMIPALVYGYSIHAYFEIIGYGANMAASYIYHFCDEQYYCFGVPFYTLLVADFVLSYNSIVISFLFLSRIPNLSFKYGIVLAELVVLIYFGAGNTWNSFVTGISVIFI